MTQPLPLLADPQGYVPCNLDLSRDVPMRAYWLGLFRQHFPSLLGEAMTDAQARGKDIDSTRRQCDASQARFYRYLDEIDRHPARFERLDILDICLQRERILRGVGLDDPYRLTKARENQSALELLPSLLDELDTLDQADLPARLIEGIFAGNIFDLGVTTTLEMFKSGPVDFHATREKLKPRPWLFDDLDAWLCQVRSKPSYRCAVLFVDNAGCDIVLGMIPFARDLLARGTGVILTANSTASLNDITHDELQDLIEDIASWDSMVAQALADGRLELIPSGNGTPLIDLSQCSRELVEAVRRRGVDLIVLEGMGRSLESNFDARFTCDCLRVAMIKDEGVAQAVDGQLFDLVCRFHLASRR